VGIDIWFGQVSHIFQQAEFYSVLSEQIGGSNGKKAFAALHAAIKKIGLVRFPQQQAACDDDDRDRNNPAKPQPIFFQSGKQTKKWGVTIQGGGVRHNKAELSLEIDTCVTKLIIPAYFVTSHPEN
jgi:hypothetical protein